MKKYFFAYIICIALFHQPVEAASKGAKKNAGTAEILMEFPAEAPSIRFNEGDLKQIGDIVGQLKDFKPVDLAPLAQALTSLKQDTLFDAKAIESLIGKLKDGTLLEAQKIERMLEQLSKSLGEAITNAKTSSILDPQALAAALEKLKDNTLFDPKILARIIQELKQNSIFDTQALEKMLGASMVALKDAISKIEFTIKPKDFSELISELTHLKLSVKPDTLHGLNHSLQEGTKIVVAGVLLCSAGLDLISNGPNPVNVPMTGVCVYQLGATPSQKRRCTNLCERLFGYNYCADEERLSLPAASKGPRLLMAPKPENKSN